MERFNLKSEPVLTSVSGHAVRAYRKNQHWQQKSYKK